MGYPKDFKIPVSDTQAYRQFGNSVVVPVVERIAKAVVATLRRPVESRADLVLVAQDKANAEAAGRKTKPVSYLKSHRKSKSHA